MILPIEIINTKHRIITVNGKVLYNDRKRKIDLKRPIKDLFDTASPDVRYMMELCLSKDVVVRRVEELAEKDVLPVILYFYSGGKKDD